MNEKKTSVSPRDYWGFDACCTQAPVTIAKGSRRFQPSVSYLLTLGLFVMVAPKGCGKKIPTSASTTHERALETSVMLSHASAVLPCVFDFHFGVRQKLQQHCSPHPYLCRSSLEQPCSSSSSNTKTMVHVDWL